MRIRLALLGLALFNLSLGETGIAQQQTRQVYLHTAPSINASATNFHYGLSGLRAWSTSASNEQVLWEQTGQFANFCVDESVASGVGVTTTYTLQINGSNTSTAVAITNSLATTCDTVDAASITAGQSFVIERSTAGGTPAASAPTFTLEFLPTTTNKMVYGGVTALRNNVDAFWNPFHNPSTYAAAVSGPNEQSVFPVAGTITGWRVRLPVAPSAGDSRIFCWVKNAVTQDGTAGTPNTCITIAETAQTGTATFTLTNDTDDIFTIFEDAVNNPTNSAVQVSWTHEPTLPGYWMIGASPTGSTAAAARDIALGSNGWSAPDILLLPTVSDFFFTAIAGLASAANDGRTLLVRKDGATPGGTPTATMAGGATGFLGTGEVEITSSNTWGIQTNGSGTPDLTWTVAGITQDSIATGAGRLLLFGVGK